MYPSEKKHDQTQNIVVKAGAGINLWVLADSGRGQAVKARDSVKVDRGCEKSINHRGLRAMRICDVPSRPAPHRDLLSFHLQHEPLAEVTLTDKPGISHVIFGFCGTEVLQNMGISREIHGHATDLMTNFKQCRALATLSSRKIMSTGRRFMTQEIGRGWG